MNRTTAAALVLVIGAALAAGSAVQASQWPAVHGRGVCNTPWGWCPLPAPTQTRVGVECHCIMRGSRFVTGCTESRWYAGHVNPYFNPHGSQSDPVLEPTNLPPQSAPCPGGK